MPKFSMNQISSSVWHDAPQSNAAAGLDEALSCCHNIATIAELLAACGRQEDAPPLEANIVAHAGWMISSEARKLRTLINSVDQHRECRPSPDGRSVVHAERRYGINYFGYYGGLAPLLNCGRWTATPANAICAWCGEPILQGEDGVTH